MIFKCLIDWFFSDFLFSHGGRIFKIKEERRANTETMDGPSIRQYIEYFCLSFFMDTQKNEEFVYSRGKKLKWEKSWQNISSKFKWEPLQFLQSSDKVHTHEVSLPTFGLATSPISKVKVINVGGSWIKEKKKFEMKKKNCFIIRAQLYQEEE